MTGNQDSISFDLPLSWTRSGIKSVQKKSFSFKTNHMHWISLADIPEDQNFRQVISRFKKKYPGGLLLRGCSATIACELEKKDFEILPIGQEAVLDLNKDIFNQRSLRQSARSGNRHNRIRKVDLNRENYEKLNALKALSRHGRKPQLKHLFIDEFSNNTECFIAENENGWNAALTFSRVSSRKAQAELLLRKTNAASGTMEALIEKVSVYLRSKGYLYLSLGEVPFQLSSKERTSFKSRFMCSVGKTMYFAYNSSTLFNFKNKFSPQWQPVYLCGFPRISLMSLIEIGIRTNYFRLILSQLLKKGN